jgi:hypothetical protein
MRIASFLLAVSAASVAMAAEPTQQEINKKIVELMETTKTSMREGLDVPAAEYKSDGDPETLEIVMLKKKQDGPSRVSEDGEVIFLYKASDKKQQELISEAYTLRAKRALGN